MLNYKFEKEKMLNKKALKEKYKQLKFKIGVYQIRNVVNGKILIDGSVNIDAIFNRNKLQLNFGNNPNILLQDEWKKFGEEIFRFEILSEIKEKDDSTIDYAKEAKQLAQLYIDELKPLGGKGYHKV